MAINTSNSSTLQISGSSNEVNFNVLTNDFINAKITGSQSVSGTYYHSWVALLPDSNGNLVASTVTGSLTQRPAVALNNVQFPTNAEVLIRKRCTHSTYGELYEIVSVPGSSPTSNSTSTEWCMVQLTSTSVDSRGLWQGTATTKDGTETWYIRAATAFWAINNYRPLATTLMAIRPQPNTSYSDNPRIVDVNQWYMLPIFWPAIFNIGNDALPFKAYFQLVGLDRPWIISWPSSGFAGPVNDPGFALNVAYEGNQIPAGSNTYTFPWQLHPGGRGVLGCFHNIGWMPVSAHGIWQGNLLTQPSGVAV